MRRATAFALAAPVLAGVGLAIWGKLDLASDARRTAAQLDDLGRAVARLDRRLAVLENARRAGPVFAPAASGPSETAPAGELAAKMEQLQQRLGAVEAEATERRRGREEQERRKAADLVWARAAVFDRQAAPESRLRALKMLRSANERTREVAAAALEVIARPEVHPDTRSDLISELKGLTFAELKAPILAALGDGSHEDTRKEAVQVLQGFFDDPAVVAAVTRARDGDASATVRREAAERLDQWRTGRPPGK